MKLSALALTLMVAGSLHAQCAPGMTCAEKPDKPLPQPARPGDWYAPGETMGEIGTGVVLVPHRNDGRWMWHVESVGSCAYCGQPMSFWRAGTDKPARWMWLTHVALTVADIETTHAWCGLDPRCKEGDPLMGGSTRRPVMYPLRLGLLTAGWWATTMLRKGDTRYRIGGFRFWYAIPALYDVVSGASIAANAARRGQ